MKDAMLPLLVADLHANHTAWIKVHRLCFSQLINYSTIPCNKYTQYPQFWFQNYTLKNLLHTIEHNLLKGL